MSGLKVNPDLAEKLTEAAGSYLTARATKAVSGLGPSAKQSGEDGDESKGLIGSAAEKLGEGASPVKAAVSGAGTALKDKVKGIFGKGSGGGKPKFSNVIEDLWVGAPLETVYNQWTQFQEFSKFTKAITSVDQTDEAKSNWKAHVGWFNRSWEATVLDQVPDEKIKWSSEGGKGTTKGVVTFHEMGENLTLVALNLEVHHKGFIEQLGRPFKTAPRRVHKDLKLFRRFIVSEGEETGAWRGTITDGEVTDDGSQENESTEVADQSEGTEEVDQAEKDQTEEGQDEEADESA